MIEEAKLKDDVNLKNLNDDQESIKRLQNYERSVYQFATEDDRI